MDSLKVLLRGVVPPAAVKRSVLVRRAARPAWSWATVGLCTVFGACSLQDLSNLRDESAFLADAGLGGASNPPGSSGAGNAGTAGNLGGSSGAAGASAQAGAGGAAGSSAAGSGGASGSSGSGTGGSAGTAGSGSGGVGGALAFLDPVADAGPDTNVIVDPGFEAGLSSWTTFGNGMVLTWETAGPLAGARCLHASGRLDSWAGPSYPVQGLVTPGATYRVSAWIRTASATSPIKLTARHYCSDDPTTQIYDQIVPGGTAHNYWERFEGELTIATCATDTHDVYAEGALAGEDIYLDEVRVELIAEPPP
ncbi:MAG: hypothetical protein RL033_5585 [Pseudomonadota bacterium]